jgi:hypothetical protein
MTGNQSARQGGLFAGDSLAEAVNAGTRGKRTGTVAIACARELAAFCWEAATLD